MTFAQTRLPHRASRRAMRRQLVLRRMFLMLSALLISGAFVGGFLWRQAKSGNNSVLASQPAVAEASPERKAEALSFFDEAVRARFEKRTQGALDALSKARDANPSINGCDLLLGMIALDAGDATASGQAAKKSLSGRAGAAGGNVLLGLLRWLERPPDQPGAMNAADQVSIFFVAAEQAAPLDYSVLLYRSDIERYVGRHRQGERLLIRAKHRLSIWDSSDAIASMILASLADQGAGAFGGFDFVVDAPLLGSLGGCLEARSDDPRELTNSIAPYVASHLTAAIAEQTATRAFGSSSTY